MKLVVDATAVRRDGGGLSTYATALLGAWGTAFPEDQVVVLTADGGAMCMLRDATADVRGPLRGRWSRLLAQHALLPILVRRLSPDAVLSLIPGAPLAPLGVPIVSVVHDLRSWVHPGEFPLSIRSYRRVAYHHAFHRSSRIVTVSQRTRTDLGRACMQGARKAQVVHPGADHVDTWQSEPPGNHVITFSHWTNKQPDLAIRAFSAALRSSPGADAKLHIVGASQTTRRELDAAAAALGIGDSVVVHGYLPDAEYQRLFTSASAVLMLSTFEGFGLPVIEAMRRGVHVIASRDPALQEAGGASAVYVDDEGALADALRAVVLGDPVVDALRESGLQRTREMVWESVARDVRRITRGAVTSRHRPGRT